MTKPPAITTAEKKTATGSEALLDINSIGISFGGLKAVQNFSLQLPAAGLFGLIGPNGAGKTTIFNLLTGVYEPDSGEIHLASRRLFNCRPHEITAAGIARTFQNIRLFPDLTVLVNNLLQADAQRFSKTIRQQNAQKGTDQRGTNQAPQHRRWLIDRAHGLNDAKHAGHNAQSRQRAGHTGKGFRRLQRVVVVRFDGGVHDVFNRIRPRRR